TTQGREVVDLSVEDDADRLLLVQHRLAAAVHVDDAEPPMPERGAADVGEALVIRTPVPQRRHHSGQGAVQCGVFRNDACDTAHGNPFPSKGGPASSGGPSPGTTRRSAAALPGAGPSARSPTPASPG